MSSVKTLDSNYNLRNDLIQDLLTHQRTLPELAKKYNIEIEELFFWLKNLELKLHQTIEQFIGLFPPVDDEEWLNMTQEEKNDFIHHLKKGDELEPTTMTFEELDRRIEEKKKSE